MADARGSVVASQPACDLLRRPSHSKASSDQPAQCGLALQFETGVPSTPPLGELMSPGGQVAAGELLGDFGITAQFAGDGGDRAADLRGNPATAATAGEQMIDLDPFVQREV